MTARKRNAAASSAPPAPPPADWTTAPSPGWAAAIYFAISLFFFLPAFLPGQHLYGTDYLGGGFFFYEFISERLAAGVLPKWVPYVFGGLPLFANPGSTFYPVHLLADLVLPADRVFPAVLFFQFGVAGVGMYLLAAELGCRRWVAFVAGLTFQLTGILTSWVYAGHDGRIIVASFAPLLFFFLHRGIRRGTLGPFVGAAATVGFALLSFQIQNSYYLLVAAAIWAVFGIVELEVWKDRPRLARTLLYGFGAVAFGFVMAAVNFLPFLDYIPESPRGGAEGRGYEYSISYSMPEAELLSLAVPEAAGVSVADPETGQPLFPAYEGENPFKLHTEYVGALVVLLLGVGFVYSRGSRYWWFFLGLSVFFLTIALGGNTPLYRLYFELLPGTKRFRAPSLSFFVVAMSLVLMAALTLERLARALDGRRGENVTPADPGRVAAIVGGMVGLALLGAVLSSGDAGPGGAPSRAAGWARFALFAAAIGAVLWAWTAGRLRTASAAALLAVFTAADLWVVNRRFFHTVAPPDAMFAPDDVILFLQQNAELDRVWMFPVPQIYGGGGSYGGNSPMYHEVQQVGGEHPNPLRRWVEYVGAGTRSYIDWENLMRNLRVVDTPAGQAIAFDAEEGFLEAANVRYVVSFAPLEHPGYREVHRGTALIYEDTSALPRAYLVGEVVATAPGEALERMRSDDWDPRTRAYVEADEAVELAGGPLEGEATIVEYRPDRVVVRTRANRPALLVVADNMYEGWRAAVDGAPADVHFVNHTFRGVTVPAGEAVVELEFVPRDLYTGFYVYLGAFALLAGIAVFLEIRRRNAGPAANA